VVAEPEEEVVNDDNGLAFRCGDVIDGGEANGNDGQPKVEVGVVAAEEEEDEVEPVEEVYRRAVGRSGGELEKAE
jgi:hypothetical protein